MVERTVSFQIRDKKVDDSIRLVLTYHPALNQLYEILWRAHKHVLKSPRFHSALPSPRRVAFRNPKTIRDKLVGSKLKKFFYKDARTNMWRWRSVWKSGYQENIPDQFSIWLQQLLRSLFIAIFVDLINKNVISISKKS